MTFGSYLFDCLVVVMVFIGPAYGFVFLAWRARR